MKKISFFRIQDGYSTKDIIDGLETRKFEPLSKEQISGWGFVDPRNHCTTQELVMKCKNSDGLEFIFGSWREDERKVQGAAVNAEVRNRLMAIQEKEKRKVSSKEVATIKAAVVSELLKHILPSPDVVDFMFIGNEWLAIESSVKKSEDVTANIREAIGSLPIRFWHHDNLGFLLTDWVSKEGKSPFDLGMKAKLIVEGKDGKSKIGFERVYLSQDAVLKRFEEGYSVFELELSEGSLYAFTIGVDGSIKKFGLLEDSGKGFKELLKEHLDDLEALNKAQMMFIGEQMKLLFDKLYSCMPKKGYGNIVGGVDGVNKEIMSKIVDADSTLLSPDFENLYGEVVVSANTTDSKAN